MSKLRNSKSVSQQRGSSLHCNTRPGQGGAGRGGDKPGLMQVLSEVCLSAVQLMVGQVRSVPVEEMSNNCQLCYELMDR